MTVRSDPYLQVRWDAERLLKELGIACLPIDPMNVAERLGISLMPMPAGAGGASGMLLHVGGNFGIGYPTHVASEGFKRFSIAHEIGHYRLPGHVDAIVDPSGRHLSKAGFIADDKYEREADHFASALLMPTGPFGNELRKSADGLAGVERLATLCVTSLEATAIRYVQCTRDPVAVIRSSGAAIDYAFMSSALADIPDLEWIRSGAPLAVDTVTYRFNSDADGIRHGKRGDGSSELQDWFGGPHRQKATEEVIGLGGYGKTLTILTGIEPPDEVVDQEDERDIEEAWTPRFRK
ncbi:MAG TPA: hypothetical protein DCY26_06650 [Hyphomonas sp.]|nr:hypothetical protein [Hyphomonas sp.]